MLEQITQLPNILIISGLIMIMLELFIGVETGFDLVVLGSILLIGGIVGYILPNPLLSLLLCSVLVAIYIAFARKVIKQKLIFRTKQTNIDKLIGQTGIVTKSISQNQVGSIKLSDEQWRASSADTLSPNDSAVVESVDGVTLIVKKA